MKKKKIGKSLKRTNEDQRRAVRFLNSMRGNYIISQALTKAIEVMKKEKFPEYSNIEDMKYLRDSLFPIFYMIEEGEREIIEKSPSRELSKILMPKR